MIRCLEKNYWADSECALNAVATAVILTFDHVSPPVHLLLVFHHSRCDTASSLFASKCLGECYAWMADLCDLWDPGWGDPRFPHWALLLLSPSCMAPFCFVLCCRCFASFSVAILTMTHKMTSCILCLRASSDRTSLCFVVLVLLLFCVFFVLFALFVVWFSMGPLTGLCIGPLPVLCWGYWRLDGIAW